MTMVFCVFRNKFSFMYFLFGYPLTYILKELVWFSLKAKFTLCHLLFPDAPFLEPELLLVFFCAKSCCGCFLV